MKKIYIINIIHKYYILFDIIFFNIIYKRNSSNIFIIIKIYYKYTNGHGFEVYLEETRLFISITFRTCETLREKCHEITIDNIPGISSYIKLKYIKLKSY